MGTNNEVLIIGRPRSGKTTFLAQLYVRLQDRKGSLRISDAPKNIDGIRDALNRLADGKETEPTPSKENLEVKIPIHYNGEDFILNCKDYGGEQVRDLTKLMEYDKTWMKRAKENDRWVIFIRPSEIENRYDLSMKGYAEPGKVDLIQTLSGTSYQSQFIELIQVLLHARGVGMKNCLSEPCLIVALTCWDELNTDKTPAEVLHEKLPLLFHLLQSNWQNDKFKVLGVSAQEFPLNNDENRDKYLDDLPESFGYIVLENGKEDKDLTRLIEEVIMQ